MFSVPKLPQGPIGSALSNANPLTGLLGDAAKNGSATNGAQPGLPFQIPIITPSGALNLVQGGLNGLKDISDEAKATIAKSAEIPIVLPSGAITTVKGGLDGLKDLQENTSEVLLNAAKVPLGGLATTQSGLPLPVPLPIPSAITDGLKDLHEHTVTVLGNVPQIPVLTPQGAVSVVKGGLDGLKDLHENTQDALKGGLSLGLNPTAGLQLLSGGLAGPLGALGGGLVNGIASGASGKTGIVDTISSLIQSLKNLLAGALRGVQALTHGIENTEDFVKHILSPNFGVHEMVNLVFSNHLYVLKAALVFLAGAAVASWTLFFASLLAGAAWIAAFPVTLLAFTVVCIEAFLYVFGFIRNKPSAAAATTTAVAQK